MNEETRHNMKKNLQIIYLIKDLYSENIKNSPVGYGLGGGGQKEGKCGTCEILSIIKNIHIHLKPLPKLKKNNLIFKNGHKKK